MSIRLPDGWTVEDAHWPEQQVIRRPDGCVATLDFGKRCFRLGYATVGRPAGPVRLPTGRGWRQALVDAAVACLEAI